MAREDLNPVEEARACAALVEELGLTREEVGLRVGRSRVAVSNLIRLLDLPDEALELIERRELTEGHGRALLLADRARRPAPAGPRRRRRRLVGARARGRAPGARAPSRPRGSRGRAAPPCAAPRPGGRDRADRRQLRRRARPRRRGQRTAAGDYRAHLSSTRSTTRSNSPRESRSTPPTDGRQTLTKIDYRARRAL